MQTAGVAERELSCGAPRSLRSADVLVGWTAGVLARVVNRASTAAKTPPVQPTGTSALRTTSALRNDLAARKDVGAPQRPRRSVTTSPLAKTSALCNDLAAPHAGAYETSPAPSKLRP